MRGLHTGRTEELAASIILRPLCPKVQQTACGGLAFQTATVASLCEAHLFFVLSAENSPTQAGMDGERTVGRSPLSRVATCGLRERTAVAMTTNKAVFV